MEPDWDRLADHLGKLTVKELRRIGREYFHGALGGASSKRNIVDNMVAQTRYWWRMWETRDLAESILREVGYGEQAQG